MDVSAAERILDLLIALGNARTRMTKRQIREKVNGYRGDDAAFERMFERDKEQLRAIGVPIVVDRDVLHEDDVGYRIDLDAYTLDLSLTPEEIGVLSLAREVHRSAQWQEAARRGVTKVRGLGPAREVGRSHIQLALSAPNAAFDVLCEAISERRPVQFRYAGLHAPRRTRTVEPWEILARRHAWYLLARDVESGERRLFRLSRIVGAVTPHGKPGAYAIPVHTLPPEHDPVEVRLAVRPGRAWQLRASGTVTGHETRDGETRDIVSVAVTDEVEFVDAVAGYGADAVVLAPPGIRAAVVAAFERAAEVEDHA